MSYRYPGRFALLVLAVSLVPIAIKRAKPLAKSIGDTLVKAGESLREAARESTGTETGPSSPNEDVRTESKESAVHENAPPVSKEDQERVNTASPIAQDEVEAVIAAEAVADGAASEPPSVQSVEPPEPLNPTPQAEYKPLEPDQPLNPHRTQNSPEEDSPTGQTPTEP